MLSGMTVTQAKQRLPVVFVPHGGGPWPFVKVGFGSEAEQAELARYLRSVSDLPPTPPRALLVISAHWEEQRPTVMTTAAPPLLFDYSGFPPEPYELTWPAPGGPGLAPPAPPAPMWATSPSTARCSGWKSPRTRSVSSRKSSCFELRNL